jgi:hypothetical protein
MRSLPFEAKAIKIIIQPWVVWLKRLGRKCLLLPLFRILLWVPCNWPFQIKFCCLRMWHFEGGKNTFGPPITLSRLEKHQAIQKAKRDKALTVNYSSSIPLDPEQVAFLNTPLAHREGQPLTGFDLLKLIDEATQKRWIKPSGKTLLIMSGFANQPVYWTT